MARRKKEPQGNHRKAIAQAATKLFSEKGFDNTSMADIAKESGYSKASLYVFFKDKDELLAYLTLESMTLLYDNLSNAVNSDKSIDEKYQSICDKLVEYYEVHPLYFSLMLKTIRIDPSQPNFLDEERDTFNVGQKISELISSFISSGIEKGCFRKDLDIFKTEFAFWGMLTGVIQLAYNKQEYLESINKISVKNFLSYSFEMLYQSIKRNQK